MPDFRTEDRVTLLYDMPTHTAGEHGTVHGTYGNYVGVCFDTSPHLIRYTAPSNLAPATQDVEDVTRAAEAAVLHIIETAWDVDTPCSWPDCDENAIWWWEHTCGHTIYRCGPHRYQQDTRMEQYDIAHPGQPWRCAACRTTSPSPIPWRAL